MKKSIFLAIFCLFVINFIALGQSDEELKRQIDQKSAEIKQLEIEIENYKKQIDQTGKEANTLRGIVKQLEATKAKLTADIKLTEKRISSTNLSIRKLGTQIGEKEENIKRNLQTIALTLRRANEIDQKSPVEIILSNENLHDTWNELETLEQFQVGVGERLDLLRDLKEDLEQDKKETEQEKKKLVNFKGQLSDQQKLVVENQKEKNQVLKETRSRESEYRKILADRLAKKDQLEREILEFEAKLKVDVDVSLLPKVGKGILAFPLDIIKITQYFGNTKFATQNPQVYSGGGHNGVDFAVSPGTPVKSAEDGVVVDTGDTDLSCYRVSYGKWVLVRHVNGLSTLYAHLSLIKMKTGDGVLKGDVLGYSGNTGYSTGPHLHFTVFASQAVHVSGPTEYKSRVCNSYLKIPVSPRNGYLNPLSYL